MPVAVLAGSLGMLAVAVKDRSVDQHPNSDECTGFSHPNLGLKPRPLSPLCIARKWTVVSKITRPCDPRDADPRASRCKVLRMDVQSAFSISKMHAPSRRLECEIVI